MNELSVAFKVVSERNCPFYAAEDLFILTSQSVQVPLGHPSCLIMVREMTNLLFNTIVPAIGTGFEELKRVTYNCGGCTGLIKFQIEENPASSLPEPGVLPVEDKEETKDTGGSSRPGMEMEGVVVSGLLSEISPSELLQFFHMHQKTGKLVLDAAAGTGRVIFREGAIIEAEFLEHEGKEAIFALLREYQGRFSFVNGIPAPLLEVEDVGDFMMLLMEGIKRMDEEGG